MTMKQGKYLTHRMRAFLGQGTLLLALLIALGVATGLFPVCGLEIVVGQIALRMVGRMRARM